MQATSRSSLTSRVWIAFLQGVLRLSMSPKKIWAFSGITRLRNKCSGACQFIKSWKGVYISLLQQHIVIWEPTISHKVQYAYMFARNHAYKNWNTYSTPSPLFRLQCPSHMEQCIPTHPLPLTDQQIDHPLGIFDTYKYRSGSAIGLATSRTRRL